MSAYPHRSQTKLLDASLAHIEERVTCLLQATCTFYTLLHLRIPPMWSTISIEVRL